MSSPKSNPIQNFTKLFPTILGIDEYDYIKLNTDKDYSWKKDLVCSLIILFTISYLVFYTSLNTPSLSIDEFL